jgi:hypothetical protein
MIPGTKDDHIRFLYIELNNIYYYTDSILCTHDLESKLGITTQLPKEKHSLIQKLKLLQTDTKFEKYKELITRYYDHINTLPDKLYYYKIKDKPEYLISRYTMSEITQHNYNVDNLIECDLLKDNIYKNFKFVKKETNEKVFQNGGDIIKNNDIYLENLHDSYIKLLNQNLNVMHDKLYLIEYIFSPSSYLVFSDPSAINKEERSNITNIIKAFVDSKKNIYDKKYKNSEIDINIIIKYKFEHRISLKLYDVLYNYKLLQSKNTLLISKNHYFRNTLQYQNIDTDFLLYTYFPNSTNSTNSAGKTKQYLDRFDLKYTEINKPLTNVYIDKLRTELKEYDLIIIDLNIFVEQSTN